MVGFLRPDEERTERNARRLTLPLVVQFHSEVGGIEPVEGGAAARPRPFEQILNAFEDCRGPDVPKYVAAPCSNCKGQMRDLIDYYELREKEKITYAGLVKLIVNAMVDVKPGFIKWEDAM